MITVKTVKGIKYVYWQSITIDGKRKEECLGKLGTSEVLTKAVKLIDRQLDDERIELYGKLGIDIKKYVKNDNDLNNVVKEKLSQIDITREPQGNLTTYKREVLANVRELKAVGIGIDQIFMKLDAWESKLAKEVI